MSWKNLHFIPILSFSVLILSLSSCNKRETLIVYSNAVSGGRGDWMVEQWNKADFDFDIAYVDIGGSNLANRLIAEKSNPMADVVLGLNDLLFAQVMAEDILDIYVPIWANENLPQYNHPDGYHHGFSLIANVLIYNGALYDASSAPQDWPDLWNNPQFHKLYETKSDLGTATTRIIIAGLLTRHRDDNGELGVSAQGWQELAKYYQYSIPTANLDIDTHGLIANGDIHFSQMWSGGIPSKEALFGVSTPMVNPAIGVPFVAEGVALVKGTKKAEQAKIFIDWVGSEEIQSGWAKNFSTLPTNQKALIHATDFAKNIQANYKAQDIDWSWVARHMDKWIEKIELEFI